jgi:FkbM family methyltransferase
VFDADRYSFLTHALGANRNLSILDIGANPINEPIYALLRNQELCDVIGFEPQKVAFDTLQSQKKSNETYVNAAVGDGSTQDLYLYEMSGFTSFFKIHEGAVATLRGFWKGTREIGVVPLATKPLDSIEDIQNVDLLKIDVQGAEYQVISSGKHKLENVFAVIIELRYFRLYEDEPMFGEIDSFLRSRGLVLHKFIDTKSGLINSTRAHKLRPRRANSQAIDGDAVYIKDITKLGDFSLDQLIQLALAADGVFYSFDLVLALLDELVKQGVMKDAEIDAYSEMLPQHLRVPS